MVAIILLTIVLALWLDSGTQVVWKGVKFDVHQNGEQISIAAFPDSVTESGHEIIYGGSISDTIPTQKYLVKGAVRNGGGLEMTITKEDSTIFREVFLSSRR